MIDFNKILFHTYSSFLRNVPFTALLALQFKQLLTCLQSNPFWLDLRVFVSPDRTLEERICRQKLVNELKEKRSADPNKHYIIRKGEVVFLSERTGCVDNVWLFFFTAHNSLCIEFSQFTAHIIFVSRLSRGHILRAWFAMHLSCFGIPSLFIVGSTFYSISSFPLAVV